MRQSGSQSGLLELFIRTAALIGCHNHLGHVLASIPAELADIAEQDLIKDF
jgi:hypothetical protein